MMPFQSFVHHLGPPPPPPPLPITFNFNPTTSCYGNKTPQRSLLPDCPYRQAQEQMQQPVRDDLPFYRTIYYSTMEDTYDGTTMIDATQLRACAHDCLCRTFRCPCTSNPSPLEFIVSQDSHQTRILFRSDNLLHSFAKIGVSISGREVAESELLGNATVIQRGLESRNNCSVYDHIGIDFYGLDLLVKYLTAVYDSRITPSYFAPVLRARRFKKSRISDRFRALERSFPLSNSGRSRIGFLAELPDNPLESETNLKLKQDCFCLTELPDTSPEETLIKAVRMRALHDVSSLLMLSGNGMKRRVFNPNSIIDGSTALIEAIRTGCELMVEHLISAGADVNTIAPSCTPLSIAAQKRSRAIIRLLLDQGADPISAMILLKSGDSSSSQKHLQLLTDVMDQYKEEVRKAKITELHENFRQEYRNISRAARQVSPDQCEDEKTVLQRKALQDWKRDVNSCAEAAWTKGVRMLRKLCSGNIPRNVNEVIMGIALARAMAVILGKQIDKGILHDLNEDLSRWQVLFSEEVGFAFSDAVWRIWGVILVCPFSKGYPVAGEIVEDFRNMAEQLMEKAHDVFGLGEMMDPSDSDWDRDGCSSRDTDHIRHDQDFRLYDRLKEKQQCPFDRGSDQTTLIWLMSGVVFACCIAALLVLHLTQANIEFPANYFDPIKKAVFSVSVGHILEHEKHLPDVRNGFIEEEVQESILHGIILSVDALKRCIDVCSQKWIIDEPERQLERQRLLRGCDDWSNFIQMQISRGVIELYLQQISSATAQSGSNADSPEAEQLQEATSSAGTEMSSFQFSSSSHPSEEQHTPSLDQETLLQSDLDNSDAASRINSSHRASRRKLYACDICNHSFTRSNLRKHKQDMHNPKGKKTHKCTVCGRGFGRDDNRRHHEEKKHGLRFEDRRKRMRRSG